MTFDDQTIMAYVDGECDAVTVRRIEKAMISDTDLTDRIGKARALRAIVAAHYAPVASEEIPDRLTAMLAPAAPDVDTSFAARKAGREQAKQQRRSFGLAQWGAMAATLVLGVVVGQYGLNGDPESPFAQQGGALVASGPLENALDRQLASTQADDSDFRIGLTFRARTGAVCRSFTGEAVSGIGCREGQQWKMVSTLPGGIQGDYRQASSNAINAVAAELMVEGPMDADAERKSLESGWK